jgi:hypothetical protein
MCPIMGEATQFFRIGVVIRDFRWRSRRLGAPINNSRNHHPSR